MWLQPPFFWMLVLQFGQFLVLLSIHSDVSTSSSTRSPYFCFSARRSASSFTRVGLECWPTVREATGDRGFEAVVTRLRSSSAWRGWRRG